jgi:hypothetical protein
VQQDGQWPKLVTAEILLKVRRQSERRKSRHESADWLIAADRHKDASSLGFAD